LKRKQSKDKDKQSIIYIAQPTFNEGNLNMQKTFVIKPEKKVEFVSEEEKEITIEGEAIIAEAEVIEEVKAEEEFTKELQAEDEQPEVRGMAAKKNEVVEEEKEITIEGEGINTREEEAVIAEAEVIEEVKAEGEFTKELQAEGEQPETRGMAAKKNEVVEEGLSKGVQKRKPFKDMNNEEKLNFLIHRPKYIPKVKCQIITLEEKLNGYVLSYEKGYVAIKMMEKTKEIKVKFEDIVHIKMMGL